MKQLFIFILKFKILPFIEVMFNKLCTTRNFNNIKKNQIFKIHVQCIKLVVLKYAVQSS